MPIRCSTCGAWIVWGVSHKGARIPIDMSPRSDGNLVHDADTDRWRPYEPLIDGACDRYVSHFATCRHADEFSSSSRGSKKK